MSRPNGANVYKYNALVFFFFKVISNSLVLAPTPGTNNLDEPHTLYNYKKLPLLRTRFQEGSMNTDREELSYMTKDLWGHNRRF